MQASDKRTELCRKRPAGSQGYNMHKKPCESPARATRTSAATQDKTRRPQTRWMTPSRSFAQAPKNDHARGLHRQPKSSSLRSSAAPHPTPQLDSSVACPVPDTDEERTALLWRAVSSRRAAPMASQQGRFQQGTKATNAKQKAKSPPTPPSSKEPPSTSSRPRSTASNKTATNKSATNKDADFREATLAVYGITFVKQPHFFLDPHDHFKTERPSTTDSVSQWYQKSHPSCRVWLELNRSEAERIAAQYQLLVRQGENEAKFSYRGKTYFFLEDDTVDSLNPGRDSKTFFKLEWGPNPDNVKLSRPPVLRPTTREYAFNNNPDCTYWLTLHTFNSSYRATIPQLLFVLPGPRVTAPYFTIEFKKDGSDLLQAEDQLAGSVALILYNRLQLRCRSLRESGRTPDTWGHQDFADLKHYGIVFAGHEASIYMASPTLEFQDTVLSTDPVWTPWRGCSLVPLSVLSANEAELVIDLRRWINEIHNWGLGAYRKAVQFDVKLIFHHTGGKGKVSWTPEEIVHLGDDYASG